MKKLSFLALSLFVVSLSAHATEFRMVGTVKTIYCKTTPIKQSSSCPTNSEIVINDVIFHDEPNGSVGLSFENSKVTDMKTGDLVSVVYDDAYQTVNATNLSHIPFTVGGFNGSSPIKMNSLIGCVMEAFLTSPDVSTVPAQVITDARRFCSSPGVVSFASIEACLSEASAVKGLGLDEKGARAFCLNSE